MINKVKLVIGILLFLGNPLAVQALTCDANKDNVVDRTDIELIVKFKGTPVAVDDSRDVNKNGIVDIMDARQCAAEHCTAPACNRRPVANAGPDQSTPLVGATVALDGSRSMDPDGDRLTYQWTLIKVPPGSKASLSGKTVARPTFKVDKFGKYEVTLVVNDGHQNSSDQVSISTANRCPVANAGSNQNFELVRVVTLDGSGSRDLDGNLLTYRWSLIARPSGSKAVLSNPSAVKPSFLADMKGIYQAQLVVNDGTCNSNNLAEVKINRIDKPPVCKAGPDQQVVRNRTVTLDGSGSSDPDNDPLKYQWSLISVPLGSKALLSNPAAVNPTFTADRLGDTIAQLICNDGSVNGDPSKVIIKTNDIPPVANAGPDQTVESGVTVELDGTRSKDDDPADVLTYRWSLIARPSGSKALLSNPSAPKPSFVADMSGTYVAQLIVNDGTEDSKSDKVTITGDRRPVANAGLDQTVDLFRTQSGVTVELDGTGSKDDDPADVLTYRWSLIALPSGSKAVLSNPSAPKPSFVADMSGTYVVQLIVNDGTVDSDSDTVTINTVLTGQVSDPAGDSVTSSVTPSPDLVSAIARVSGGNLTLSVSFAAGTFNPGTSHVQFSLDTDQNPGTGHPGTTANGVIDAGIIGSDFLVNFGAGVNQSEVLIYAGPPINTFNLVGSASPVTLRANGMDVTIPLALLNNDDGDMNFKVTTQALIDPASPGWTGILDTMPDTGLPPGVME